jgi:hypothetical protein
MPKYESDWSGYDAEVSGNEFDEDCLPLSKKAKRGDPHADDPHAESRFGSDYCHSEYSLCADEEKMSMTSGPGDTESDTGVESACSEIEPESTAVIESLGSYGTSECESEHLSESLGDMDTSPEDPDSDVSGEDDDEDDLSSGEDDDEDDLSTWSTDIS